MSTRVARSVIAAALAAATAIGVACADDEPETTTPSTAGTATAAPKATGTPASTASTTVAVTAIDYAFQGLPTSVAIGSTLTLANRSAVELHEIVAIRIPDSERRPVSQLVQLPEAEIDAIFGEAPPAFVIIAPPSQGGMPVLGDGKLTQAGRYGILCFIPTGADPQEYLRAAQASTEGPPQVAGGPPHVANGMFAELTVR